MHNITFEWDENKDRINTKKHGVSFREAMTVFSDEYALIVTDEVHSALENRFVILGISMNLRLLVVCHCYRTSDMVVRIISARKANKSETDQYGGAL